MHAKLKIMRGEMEVADKLYDAAVIHFKEAIKIYEKSDQMLTTPENEIERHTEVCDLCDIEN